MTDWKDINPSFTEELVQNWQNQGFDFEQTKKWIEIGFNPNDYEIVAFIKNNLGYSTDTPLSSTEIENLRSIFRDDLATQSILLDENFGEQEMIRQSIISQTNDDLLLQEALLTSQQEEENTREIKRDSDRGWLTDDNVEYILKNDEVIREAKEVQIRTDIANVYLQVEKAKWGDDVDGEFWNSLDTSKRYVILPLRVRENHWSLLLFVNNKSTNNVLWIRYISSHPSPKEVLEEVKELGGFLRQASKRYSNKFININELKNVVVWETPKQRNTWDCGVYLIMFIRFLSSNKEYHKLKRLTITDQMIKEFREEWKKRIGEKKWCKWDTAVSSDRVIKERNIEKNYSLKGKMIEENGKDDSELSLSKSKEMEKEIAELKKGLQQLTTSYDYLFKELKKVQKKNEELEEEHEILQEEVFRLTTSSLTNEIRKKEKKLNKFVSSVRNRLEDEDLLEDFFEAQKEFNRVKSSFASKQLEKHKNKLIKNGIREEEVKKLCDMIVELNELEKEFEQQQLEANIEVSNK